MGFARPVYQRASADATELTRAREDARNASALFAQIGDHAETAQMSAQADALALLIEQRLVALEKAPEKRLQRYVEVRAGLEQSYLVRLALARQSSELSVLQPPESADGLGAERAYYNLAGVNLQIAKTAWALDHSDPRVHSALSEATAVYETVRQLRLERYRSRPHPHLAACIHGLAIVMYFRALYGFGAGEQVDAVLKAQEGLWQRMTVAKGLSGDPRSVARDNDVGKSVELLVKICLLALVDNKPAGDVVAARAHAMKIVDEALSELDQTLVRYTPEDHVDDEEHTS
ncbi:MAG: hypothetical protein QM747_14840 [Nocardioides sp.]